jgi:hypothetical protein
MVVEGMVVEGMVVEGMVVDGAVVWAPEIAGAASHAAPIPPAARAAVTPRLAKRRLLGMQGSFRRETGHQHRVPSA